MKSILNFPRNWTPTMNQIDHSHFACSRQRRAAKTAMLLLSLVCTIFVTGLPAAQAQTQPSSHACTAAVDELMSRWQAIRFEEPAKPAQQVVNGRHGYRTTGGQFHYMRQQIRAAALDCEQGRDADSLLHVYAVHAILEHLSHS